MDKLRKIEQHLSKGMDNKVVIDDKTYFRNVYCSITSLTKEEAEKEMGRDIKFVHNGIELRRFSFEDGQNDRFVFTDHASSIEELDRAKVAFIMLDEVLSEEVKTEVNLKEL